MSNPTPNDIRQKVLKERGLTSFKPDAKRRRHLKPVPTHTINPKLKTPMMRYIELIHGEPIERILLSGSLSVVAKHIDNVVDVSTLSKWIKKLRLRYTTDNLPRCHGCKRYGPACNIGICYILMELKLYGLVDTKKEQMIKDGILCEE